MQALRNWEKGGEMGLQGIEWDGFESAEFVGWSYLFFASLPLRYVFRAFFLSAH